MRREVVSVIELDLAAPIQRCCWLARTWQTAVLPTVLQFSSVMHKAKTKEQLYMQKCR